MLDRAGRPNFDCFLAQERALRQQLGMPASGLLDLELLQPAASSADPNAAARAELVKLYSARLNIVLNFIKNFGDFVISANGSYLRCSSGAHSARRPRASAGVASGLAVIVQVARSL